MHLSTSTVPSQVLLKPLPAAVLVQLMTVGLFKFAKPALGYRLAQHSDDSLAHAPCHCCSQDERVMHVDAQAAELYPAHRPAHRRLDYQSLSPTKPRDTSLSAHRLHRRDFGAPHSSMCHNCASIALDVHVCRLCLHLPGQVCVTLMSQVCPLLLNTTIPTLV